MPVESLSLESLKAYPPGLVAVCAGLVLAVVLMLLAKPLKWGMYLLMVLIWVAAMGALVLWLWSGQGAE